MALNSVYYTWNVTWGSQSGQVTGTITGDNYVQITDLVGTSVTNKQYNCAVDASGLSGWWLLATNALTIKTNSTGSPDNTFVLTANVPQFWITGVSGTNPISVDITAIYVTNASGSNTSQLSMFFIGDNSP